MKKQKWFTQTILFYTSYFGKDYFMMQDVDGHIYLVKAVPNITGHSVDPQTGTTIPVVEGLKPDFS
jgi:hypothetical protein